MNLLHIVIHYSKRSKSVQNIVIRYIFNSESLRVVNSLQIVNSLRVLFLVCRGPLGGDSRPATLGIVRLAIRDSVPLRLQPLREFLKALETTTAMKRCKISYSC